MTGLHELKPAKGSKKNRKRVGRGDGSTGTFSGKGSKGQAAHGKVPYLFEGGQLPLIKRLPHMRGFTPINRVEYLPVNLARLDSVFEDGADITPEVLIAKRIVRRKSDRIKILGDGDFGKKLNISAHAFSQTARDKIEKAGGTATVITTSKGS